MIGNPMRRLRPRREALRSREQRAEVDRQRHMAAVVHPVACRGCDHPFTTDVPDEYDGYCPWCAP